MPELIKAYEPKKYEDDIYKRWEDSGFFNPDVCIKKGITDEAAPYFSIVLPPPNVTGTLHMGHAAMLAIEDVMARYHRMRGERTLWVPGTDHAAIATQSKVEKILWEDEKKTRHDLGRAVFLKRVNDFAQKSHDTIVKQCKKMGASLDWSREAFTLDEKRNLAVGTVFKKMYDDGLIYRKLRPVNWSVKGGSTISDDEIVYQARPGKFYTFKYAPDFPFTIATTRPETKLGDSAVAVNPKDKRYKKYIGQVFKTDFLGQELSLKVIGEAGVDMSFGTGALGVTPAHSMVDYEMAVKNGLEIIKVIGEDGKITLKGGRFFGLTGLEARKKIVEELKKNNLLEKEEDIVQNVGTSDRFGDGIEVLPKLQWFIGVNKKFKLPKSKIKGIKNGQKVSLKELMQVVVKKSQIKIIPDRFEQTYFHWIDNLRDWCISRQIWYGHRVPVWYHAPICIPKKGSESEVKKCIDTVVAVNSPVCQFCDAKYIQDEDTLDTWFSSGLWTFSTLGYPDLDAEDLKNYHPTSVMETGYDILFFWVARMILLTTYTLGEIPFQTVYLHGLVRDAEGRKMSKTLGNTINPLDMIEKYGTDATRLSLLLGVTPGNDMKLSEEKIAGFRNFANKLWNISRFIIGQIRGPNYEMQIDIKEPKAGSLTLADRSILSRLTEITKSVTSDIEKYQFSIAGERLREFTWNELADWYLEVAKIEGDKVEILNYVLNTILKLWHPFMPFVTEAIWKEIYGGENMLMVEQWPEVKSTVLETKGGKKSTWTPSYDTNAIAEFDRVKNIIQSIRYIKSNYNIAVSKKIPVIFSKGTLPKWLSENIEYIERRAGVIIKKESNSKLLSTFNVAGVDVSIDIGEGVDVEKEKARLQKEIKNIEPYVKGQVKKIGVKDFIKNAPKEVVEAEKKKLAEAQEKLGKLQQQLKHLNI